MISGLFYIGISLLFVISYCFASDTITKPDASIESGKDMETCYFPPPESEGGWRKLEGPEDIQRLAGMDPAKLDDLKQWLLGSDDRPFAAVVVRNGYIVLEVERERSKSGDWEYEEYLRRACAAVKESQ